MVHTEDATETTAQEPVVQVVMLMWPRRYHEMFGGFPGISSDAIGLFDPDVMLMPWFYSTDAFDLASMEATDAMC